MSRYFLAIDTLVCLWFAVSDAATKAGFRPPPAVFFLIAGRRKPEIRSAAMSTLPAEYRLDRILIPGNDSNQGGFGLSLDVARSLPLFCRVRSLTHRLLRLT